MLNFTSEFYSNWSISFGLDLPCVYGYLEGFLITGTNWHVGETDGIGACAIAALTSYSSSWGVTSITDSSGQDDCYVFRDPSTYSTPQLVRNTAAKSCFLRGNLLQRVCGKNSIKDLKVPRIIHSVQKR